ncbi:MAG: GlxA family transcriptional regulator [Rhodospirillales bacterium]
MQQINTIPEAPLRLAILLLPEFTLSAFSLFLDPIRLASDDHDRSRQIRCNWRVLTLNNRPVKSSCGVEVYPTASRLAHENVDWLVVVGGLTRSSIHDDERVLDMIRTSDQNGVPVIGLCTGVFSMAAAGVLDDDVCCVSWFHRDELVSRYDLANVDSSRLFHFGTRHVTCAGGVGAAHVALEIIRRKFGEDVANKSAGILLMPQYWAHTIEQPMAQLAAVRSTKVRDALRYMEARLDEPLRLVDIAGAVGVSVRQLERLFNRYAGHAPRTAMTLLRMQKARSYLAETDMPVIEIALACGFPSPSHFAVTFKQAFGLPPSAYRKRLGTE